MTHFVIYARRAELSADDIERISGTAGVTLLDDEVGGALLIDTTPDRAEILRERFPNWVIAEEIEYPPPDTQPYKIEED